jgi:hypothetical protein
MLINPKSPSRQQFYSLLVYFYNTDLPKAYKMLWGDKYKPRGWQIEFNKDLLHERLCPECVKLASQNKVCKDYRDSLLVQSGHGVGKSDELARYALLTFICCLESPIIIVAPTENTAKGTIWQRVKTWYLELPDFVKEDVFHKDGVMIDKLIPSERLDVANKFIELRAMSGGKKEEASRGAHTEEGDRMSKVLILLEEATGVDEKTIKSLRGSLTSFGSRIIAVTQPNKISGFWYDLTSLRNKDLLAVWKVRIVNAEEEPTVSKRWIQTQLAQCGGNREHEDYRVRVRGLPPLVFADEFIDAEKLYAIARDDLPFVYNSNDKIIWGCDVGVRRDTTTIVKGTEDYVFDDMPNYNCDGSLEKLCNFLNDELQKSIDLGLSPDYFLYDINGVGQLLGDAFKKTFESLGLRTVVIPVNTVNKATEERFTNLRAQLADSLRNWIYNNPQNKKRLPSGKKTGHPNLRNHQLMLEELLTMRGKLKADNKLVMENKEEHRKRLDGKRSPNYADALILRQALIAMTLTSKKIKMVPNQQRGSGMSNSYNRVF